MRAPDDRPLFTVPRGPQVYVGTTDTSYDGPLEEPSVTADDAAYVFETLHRTFPDLRLEPEHVVGAWAGIRPLVHEEGRKPSEISRKDEVTVSGTGLITIAGGKLTTYRRMAERVLEAAIPFLDRIGPAGRSGIDPLAGGGPVDAAALATLPPDVRARLLAVHGSDAGEVAACADDAVDLAPLAAGIPLTAAEVRHAVRHEMARTLADVLERRSRLALFATASGRDVGPRVAALLAVELGWSPERRDAEVATFTRQCDARLAWRGLDPRPDARAAVGTSA